MGEISILLCKTKQHGWISMAICLPRGRGLWVTPKLGIWAWLHQRWFWCSFIGILLVLRIANHLIIERFCLMKVIEPLAPEKIKSGFFFSRKFSGIQLSCISPFRGDLQTLNPNRASCIKTPATVSLLAYPLSKSFFGDGPLWLISNWRLFMVCFNNLFSNYHYISRLNNSSCSLGFSIFILFWETNSSILSFLLG